MTNQPTSPVATTPKSVTPELQKGIDNHKKAAAHHDLASKHHLKAAEHHELGQKPEAADHTLLAHGHAVIANDCQRDEAKRKALLATSK